MSLRWVILGTVLQLMRAYFLFMLVVFSAAGMGNESALSKVQTDILNFSMYALPATCLVSAGIVFSLYKNGGGSSSYWWHGLPWVAMAVYLVYAINLNNRA
jgi:hypothetical protein